MHRLSEEAEAWVHQFDAATREWVHPLRVEGILPLRTFITVTAINFYKTDKPDLSIELILDCLETCGIIDNDRHVRGHHAEKLYSEEYPGALIVVQGRRDCG